MSRDSRIGLPLSSDSSTAKKRLCFWIVAREGVEMPRAAVAAERPPSGLRGAGRAHRAIHVGVARLGQPRERLAGGGVQGLEGLRARLGPRAADEEPESPAVLLQPRHGPGAAASGAGP